jgi:hypothetical protein
MATFASVANAIFSGFRFEAPAKGLSGNFSLDFTGRKG